MTEKNYPINLEQAKKLVDEHQDLHKFLSDKNFENTSLVFFNPNIEMLINYGNYLNTVINLSQEKINKECKNKLYLPGIKIEKNKVYTEQELGKTISNEILRNDNPFTYCNPHNYIFKLFKKESGEIPQSILDSIKQIELLEVQIIKEKNKILNSIYVKNKLNYQFDNIDEYKNFIKCKDNLRENNLV